MEIKCPDLNECDLMQCSAFKLINKVGNLHHCSCTHPHTTCTIAAIAYGLISYRKRTCYKWHEVCHIRQRPWSEYMLRIEQQTISLCSSRLCSNISCCQYNLFKVFILHYRETSFHRQSVEKLQDFSLESNYHQLMDEKTFICLSSLRV